MPSDFGNLLINSLSPESRKLILHGSVQVPLPLRTSLYEAEETPHYAYFMTSGIASVVTSVQEGGTAEIGLIGREGVVGAFHLLGPAVVPSRSFIQLEGTGIRVPLGELQNAFYTSTEIHDRLLEFVQEQALSLGQLAGCHRLHGAEERLARWLLMAQDRTQSETLGFTQEFLAMMLGAQRTTVTLIAGSLQQSGLVEYHRGKVKVIDRERLEEAACECYQVIKTLLDGLYKYPWNRRKV